MSRSAALAAAVIAGIGSVAAGGEAVPARLGVPVISTAEAAGRADSPVGRADSPVGRADSPVGRADSEFAALGLQAYESPKAAPAFGLPDLEGRTRRLEDFRGKALLLFFWATW